MARLKTYRAKRRFDVTSEPKGKAARKRGHAYVIQKHAATRLHYDLRLELDGVMKSWAVTRGPSLVPGDKRLAVEVEDHPLDYNKFEGTIPKGQYGGGTVMIWDRGSWQADSDPHKGLTKGHLAFHIDGEKLHGGWHLVRMHRRRGETRNNWLLIKQDDDAARGAREADILEAMPLSAASGRDMDEIAEGAPKKKQRAAKVNTKTKPGSKAKPRQKRPAGKKSAALRAKSSARRSEPPHAALPDFVVPCLATLAGKAPERGPWIHEIKFDGYRLQARLDGVKVRLRTRSGLDWTARFKPIATALARLSAETALIDGEVVVEDETGASSFSLLQQALKNGGAGRMVFYAFDLLHLDGADLRKSALTERKQALAKLIKPFPKTGNIRFSQSFDDEGPVLHKHACRLGLEGIVSKRSDAPYHSGRGHDWLKIKCTDRQEFVIGGFAPSTNDAHSIGALALGYYDGGKLHYAGRTGTGFTHASARSIYKALKPLLRDKSAFDGVPVSERGKNAATWVDPKLVAEVDFHGWTHDDHVRHASFQGLREDKKAKDIVRERKIAAAAVKADKKRSATAKSHTSDDTVGAVRLSHPDRMYWEDAGVTKRGLAEYYTQVWKWMRPHVTGRVISLLRCPEGATGQCFFQKHASAGIDTKHLHLVREPKGDKSISIDDLDGLIALVQGGVLEVHVRGSSTDHLEQADRLVFDLDPGPGTGWPDIVAAARDVRARLQKLKLKSFVKTSGGKGLHVVVPIRPTSWDMVKDFAHAFAAAMAADDPDHYLATATKSKRSGRIFIDYLRNSREATAVAPYSTRARPGAPVATPVDWSELGRLKGADQYTVLNLAQRLGKLRKDPWADIGKIKQSLPKIGSNGKRG
jgi:bifunctional non-homologous end joining protein LigD